MDDEKIKHLEFIQATINRLNSNSFLIKGWSVTILSALIALYVTFNNVYILLIAIIPTLIFWFLDALYLTHERRFRGLYNDVADICKKPKDIKPFEMKPELYKDGIYSFFETFKSNTLLFLYFPILVLLIIFFIIIKCQ